MPTEFKRQLSHRVQEFELWKDDKDVFKDVEYARRRADRRREVKKLESNKKLKFWRKVYIPSLLAILGSSIVLLVSSVSSLGQNSFFFTYKHVFHIVGPIVLLLGVVGLMVAAACSYKQEEILRIQMGLPSQFPQARSLRSSKNSVKMKEVDRASEFHDFAAKRKIRRMGKRPSSNSLEISNFLESSTSSATTDMTWLQHSVSRPLTLEVAEAHVFETCEEERHYEIAEDTHTFSRHVVKMHPQTSRIAEGTECVGSENSSGYSTVAGSEPEHTHAETSTAVVIEVTDVPQLALQEVDLDPDSQR